MGRISRVRTTLEKSESVGLTSFETITLRGDLAAIAAKVAKVNARVGREVVTLSPFAKMAGSPAVVV